MTVLDAPALFGVQTPRVESVPQCAMSLGDQAVAFAAKAGLELDPWQKTVLRGSMGVAPGGKWAGPQVGLLVPRQNGKGAVLEALELFHMFVLGTKLIIHSAHRFDTSQEHFLRLQTLIEGNPDLDRHVASMPKATGKEAIILRNGNRLKFKARTLAGSGRGFSADLLVLDEAMVLPEKSLDAMLPTLRARKNPQVWFTSSAGDQDSSALWRIVKRGREKAPRLAYYEWGLPSGADPLDRQNWAVANPGLGYRLDIQGLEDDLDLMSVDGFAREHLGLWDDAAASGIFGPGRWAGCADPTSQIPGTPTFGIDVSMDRTNAAISVCGAREDGLLHLETVLNQPGTEWIVAESVRLTSKHGGSVVIDPASPAGSLIDDLATASVRVHEVTARTYAQACGWLFDAVKERQVRHLSQAELDGAEANARQRELAGGFAWDRKNMEADITPLVSATLACWGHRTYGGNIAEAVW